MSKQIWLSPILGNSRERLVTRCADMIRRGETGRLLYITASHPLLELVTKWILDFDTIRGVWDTLPVFLFRGFVRRVLTTAIVEDTSQPLPRRTSIDSEESHLQKSLLSQIMRRLVLSGDLTALAPLAHRDGTVNTIATLIGEIQRAAKTPEDFRAIIEIRAHDLNSANEEAVGSLPGQIDFDREIGFIYEAYARAQDEFQLTDDDADQLRALEVLGGEVASKRVTTPWLEDVELLILDGFFDFTPVQGSILRALIQRVPNVIVNLYGDELNREVFRPFEDTIEQLKSMYEDFEVVQHDDSLQVDETAKAIRGKLFNPLAVAREEAGHPAEVNSTTRTTGHALHAKEEVARDLNGRQGTVAGDNGGRASVAVRLFRCSDRETEIREIAKEIKRLVLVENFSIREIALVVRQRAAYAETIARVFAEEEIPCTIERTVALEEIPAVRALLKLFRILTDDIDTKNPRVSDLADLIKSGYFRLSHEVIGGLRDRFAAGLPQRFESTQHSAGLIPAASVKAFPSIEETALGSWNPDSLENVFAYVGSDLRLDKWLERAHRLASNETNIREVRSEIFAEDLLDSDDKEVLTDPRDLEGKSDRPGAPTREIPPPALEWSALLLSEFAALIKRMPRKDDAAKLRVALLRLLEDLQFAQTIRDSLLDLSLESALPHAALDLRALEGIRVATSAALESIEIAAKVVTKGDTDSDVTLSNLITEIERCIGAGPLRIAGADSDGLQVLEATDVRGLRFRAIFIAGLVEGGFPLRKQRDWIYPHEERERLKKYGLTLEDISPATLLKEEHYFYQAACRATERLYLTWPLVLEGGNETVASYYIDELRHALEPLEIKNEDIRRDFDGDHVFDSSSRGELASSLVRLSERQRHHSLNVVRVTAGDVEKLLEWAKEERVITTSARTRIAIARERTGDRFGRYDGLITNEDLRALLRERYGPQYVWSASALSLFGKSPFKFFAERVLKLKPRIEAALDLAAMDAGGLLHEALRRFFVKHRGERLKPNERLKLREEMRSIAEQVFAERERAVPPLNLHVWKIDREIHQLQLAQVVDYEIDLQNKSDHDGMRPAWFELGFGMTHGTRDERSTPDVLVLARDTTSSIAAETIRLRGQIDRVDKAADGTLVAYDYKLSRGARRTDMIEGRDLQIEIYLEALEKVLLPNHEIAGGGYYVLRSRSRNYGLYRKAFDRYTQLGRSVASRVDDHEWLADRSRMRQRIWQFVDAIRAGRFTVSPSAPEQTCAICDFADVCRFEKYRILRKQPGV